MKLAGDGTRVLKRVTAYDTKKLTGSRQVLMRHSHFVAASCCWNLDNNNDKDKYKKITSKNNEVRDGQFTDIITTAVPREGHPHFHLKINGST